MYFMMIFGPIQEICMLDNKSSDFLEKRPFTRHYKERKMHATVLENLIFIYFWPKGTSL